MLIPGIPAGHDIFFHAARIESISEGLSHGTFPVRIYPGVMNTGYANGLFYPDVFLYLPAALKLAGLPTVVAYKIFIALCFGLGAASMYYAVRRIAHESFAGFAAGILYMLSSYAASVLLIRASLGEMQCFPFLPLVVLGMYNIFFRAPRQGVIPLVCGMTGIAFSHVITLFLTTVFIGCLCVFFMPKLLCSPLRIWMLALSAILTVLLTSFFYPPMIEMLANGTFCVETSEVSASAISTRTIPVTRLWLELPYMKTQYWHPAGIGIVFLVILIVRLRLKLPCSTIRLWQDTMLIFGTAMLLCCTDFLPWEGLFSAIGFIQFPWRLYLLALVCLSVGGALTVSALSRKKTVSRFRWTVGLTIGCFSAYFLSATYIYAAKIFEHETMSQETVLPAASAIAAGHYLPSGINREALFTSDSKTVENISGNAPAENVDCETGGRLSFQTSGLVDGECEKNVYRIPFVFYRGYRAVFEPSSGSAAMELECAEGRDKFLTVALPGQKTSGKVRVFYGGTPTRRVCEWISLSTFIILLTSFLVKKCRKGKA